MAFEAFLGETLAVLATAVAVLLLFGRLRLPAVAGLPLTGVLIGPSGLGLVTEQRVEVFAEIGVVLLLFTIGLELSVGLLAELRRPFLLGGSLQAGLTAGAAAGGLAAFGVAPREALLLAAILVLSSTAVVLKLYGDRGESETPQARLTLAILLFQDFLVVPLLVLTPALAGRVAAPRLALGLFAASLAGLGALFLAARYLVPRLLDRFVKARVREVFVLGALALCLAMAWLTQSLGLSAALGAFLAGVLVAESEYSHQVVADVAPFRDVFASVFFVSIGMLVDLPLAVERLPAILAAAAGVVALKATAAGATVRLLGYPHRIAVLAGLGLAQIGEFSFLLMTQGRAVGLLSEETFQLLLATAVLTLLATPAVVRLAPPLAALLGRRAPPAPASAEPAWADHVVIVGYGVNGSLLASVLEEAHVRYVVVELAAETAQRARRQGRPVVYGDATRREILERAGLPRAAVVVFAISDAVAVERGVRLARQLNPGVEILVRTRRVHEIEALQRAGADHVVAEEFETAIEVFTHVLTRLHVPRHLIRAQTRTLRGENYRMLRTPALRPEVSQAVLDALAAGTTDLFQVDGGSALVGRTLRQLDLRQRAGATVIAVVRGERSHTNPSPEMKLEAGDCLVLVGSHQEVDRAFEALEELGAPPGASSTPGP